MRVLALLAVVTGLVWGSVVSGQLLDKATGKPIAGGIVIAGGKEYRADTNGSFRVESPDGTVSVRAVGYGRKFFSSGGFMYLESFKPKALYLSSFGATDKRIMGRALDLIHKSELNAVVIDVKMDRGQIAFRSKTPMAEAIGAQKMVLFSNLPNFVARLKRQGVYTIARVVSFKDSPLGMAHPEWAVHRADGSLFKDRENLIWVDPSRREVWNYILSIAKEAAQAGFDEVQFDYVRFPDAKGIKFSVPNTPEERVKAISGFLAEARKQLTPYNVFVSADIFGYASWNTSDTDIGQKLEALAPHMDYLSPMLYPSGFKFGIPGYKNPMAANYEIVKYSLDEARKRLRNSSLAYRPWLQAFKDYAFDRRIYGPTEIRDQIRASDEFGSCGWILWNPRNVYEAGGLR